MRDEEQDGKRVTRRTFVATGVATGAAVVWTSPFPFADSPIGQTAEAQAVTGPTGTVTPSPTGTATPTASATPTATTGPTGPIDNRPTKIAINAKAQLKERKGHVVVVPITVTGSRAVKGTVKLDTLINGRPRSLGSARFQTPGGGGKRNVRVKLNRLGRELSADRKRIPARVTASGGGVKKRKAVAIKTLSA